MGAVRRMTIPAATPKAPVTGAAPVPEKPKRAPSAYSLFLKAKFKEFQKPGEGAPVVAGKIGAAWKALSEAEKKPYTDAANVFKAEKAEKEKVDAAGKPEKKPLSSYMQYAVNIRPEMAAKNPNASFTELSSLIGAAWKALPEEKKLPYKKNYDDAMIAWKAKNNSV